MYKCRRLHFEINKLYKAKQQTFSSVFLLNHIGLFIESHSTTPSLKSTINLNYMVLILYQTFSKFLFVMSSSIEFLTSVYDAIA